MVKQAAASSSTTGSHCQNCLSLKAKIRQQISAFKLLSLGSPELGSELLIKNVEELLGKPCDNGVLKCNQKDKQVPTSQMSNDQKGGPKRIINSGKVRKQKVTSRQNAMRQGGGSRGTKKKVDMIKRKYSKGQTKRMVTHQKTTGQHNNSRNNNNGTSSNQNNNNKNGEDHDKNSDEPRRSQRQVKPRRKSSPSPSPPSLSARSKKMNKYGRGILNQANFFDSRRRDDSDDDDDDGMPTLRTHHDDESFSESEKSYSGQDGNESDDWSSGPDEWFSAAELQGIPYIPPDAQSGDDNDDEEEEEEMDQDEGAHGKKPSPGQINSKIRQLARMEGKTKIIVYQCKICSKSFEKHPYALRHVRLMHLMPRKKCPFCKRGFDNRNFLRHEPICKRRSGLKQDS